MENLNLNLENNQESLIETTHDVVVVLFETTKKRYYFELLTNMNIKKGDFLIVETIRGKEVGIACGAPIKISSSQLTSPLKPIIKKADVSEINCYKMIKEDSKKAFKICSTNIKKHNLDMKLVTTEYNFDKSKLIFYFTAEDRIDFRELVKDLANIFKTRIELRQIGVRDEARILGNIGLCGKELCCRTFINKFDSVSIKMARDQGLVINPAKISGVCGRLLCCIGYEYATYEEALAQFPTVNQIVTTESGNGKVTSINPLNGFLYVDVEDKGIMRFNIEDIKFNKKEASKLKKIKSPEELENLDLERE